MPSYRLCKECVLLHQLEEHILPDDDMATAPWEDCATFDIHERETGWTPRTTSDWSDTRASTHMYPDNQDGPSSCQVSDIWHTHLQLWSHQLSGCPCWISHSSQQSRSICFFCMPKSRRHTHTISESACLSQHQIYQMRSLRRTRDIGHCAH